MVAEWGCFMLGFPSSSSDPAKHFCTRPAYMYEAPLQYYFKSEALFPPKGASLRIVYLFF